jgi:hypothetical protein
MVRPGSTTIQTYEEFKWLNTMIINYRGGEQQTVIKEGPYTRHYTHVLRLNIKYLW